MTEGPQNRHFLGLLPAPAASGGLRPNRLETLRRSELYFMVTRTAGIQQVGLAGSATAEALDGIVGDEIALRVEPGIPIAERDTRVTGS